MPLYDYRCSQCGEVFEVRQKFADALLKKHESCGGEVERLISLPALQFKGTGWYITDYKRGNGNSPASGSNGKSEGKSDSSGDSKTESKTEGKNGSEGKNGAAGKNGSRAETKSESKSEGKSDSKPAHATPAPTSSSK